MGNETKKLEILVVEDENENLDIAKEYFKGVKEVNVDYAETRDDALQQIGRRKYDGLITDRAIPKYKGAKEESSKIRHNGYRVALEAEREQIPWIVFSEHGYLMIFYPVNKRLDEETFKKIYDGQKQFDEYLSDKIPFESRLDMVMYHQFEEPGLLIKETINNPNSKKNVKSWEIAYKKLKERMKLTWKNT